MTTVYIVRHCETVANEMHLLQGSRDFPLSERGAKQLDFLKNRFCDIYLDGIYSSPQGRAFKTAEAVRGERKIEIITDDGLCEMNCGVYEGTPLFEHFEKDAELEYKWKKAPQLLDLAGGESATAVYERIVDSIKKIVKKNDGKTIAIASHGFAIRCFMAYLLFGCVDKLASVEIPGNTSVYKIEFFDGYRHKIVYDNDNDHLPDELKTFFKAR